MLKYTESVQEMLYIQQINILFQLQVQIAANNIYMDISGVWLSSESFIVLYWASVVI